MMPVNNYNIVKDNQGTRARMTDDVVKIYARLFLKVSSYDFKGVHSLGQDHSLGQSQ